jgi:outer membrane protein TolC
MFGVSLLKADEEDSAKSDIESEHQDDLESAVEAARHVLQQTLKLQDQNLASEARIDGARLDLAEAHVRLSEVKQQRDTVLENLQVVVAIRKRQLDRATKLVRENLASEATIDGARLELGESRIRLELHVILDVRERQLTRQTKLHDQGLVPLKTVENARIGLNEARERLAALSD